LRRGVFPSHLVTCKYTLRFNINRASMM